MADPLKFYFDFISPYGYLASQLIDDLAAKHGRTVDWCPLLTGISVLKVMGLKGAADTPLKGPYARHDVPRLSRYLNIPFNRPEGPLKPLAPMRAFVWLKDKDPVAAVAFAEALFRTQWSEARNLSEPEDVVAFAVEQGLDGDELRAAIDDPAVKESLRKQVNAALEAGVFGVPTVSVDGELFWGVDRFPMIDDWLSRDGW